jgi:hypothetical protein
VKPQERTADAGELVKVALASWCDPCQRWFVPVNEPDGRCTTQRCPGCETVKPMGIVQ